MIQQNLALSEETSGYWFVLTENQLLVDSASEQIPQCSWSALYFLKEYAQQTIKIGELNGISCFMVDLGYESVTEKGFSTCTLRDYITQHDASWVGLAARAFQFAEFIKTHRFCGQCGAHMQNVGWELAMHCDTCQHRAYPRISPCVIVAIVHRGQLLLAQGKRHKGSLYSVLAGFVESGETLEEAVHREVFEEVGVKLKNLQYIESQPWPFPHQLMCGFIAEYDSGDIVIDEKEIKTAAWFPFDQLPETPGVETISGRLIQYAIENHTS